MPDSGTGGVFRAPPRLSANKLDALERPHPEDNPQEIEVLDGQTSVEELLADLGFEWNPDSAAGGAATGTPAGELSNQPALF